MKRMHRKKLSLAVMNAVNAGVVVGLAAPLAQAQQAAEPQKIEKIEITGSRIPSPTLTSEAPVQVSNAQDIKYTGLTDTAAIVVQNPTVYPSQGANLANGVSGTASIDMRGLGPSRTLVLIDGKRVPAGSPNYWPTNINAIPAPLIQRVDILTSSASAIYGSDAVAGVVNFIMNDHFEGVQFDWQYNGYNHQQGSFVGDLVAQKQATNPAQFQVPGNVGFDGNTQDFSVTMGRNFANNKGNATVYFEWRQQDGVFQSQRDFSECSLVAQGPDTPSTPGTPIVNGYSCGGSSTSYPGRFSNFGAYDPSFNLTIANAAGGVRPYVTSQDQYNFAPSNYFQRPDTRYQFNAFSHYDVDQGWLFGYMPAVRLYSEFDFMDDKTDATIAPSGAFFQPFTLFNDNPLLSQSFKDAVGLSATSPAQTFYIGRRNVEGGGRNDNIENTQYRIVIGGKGSFLDDKWNYNLWWQYGKVILSRIYQNDFSVVRLGRAMDVVTSPATNQPACRASLPDANGVVLDPNCVPYDIFHIGGVTQAALNYLQTPGLQNGYDSQSVVGLNVSSDLGEAYGWTLPWAKDGIGVAGGIERRVEKLNTTTDVEFDTGDLAGQGGATHPVNGQFTVLEPYVEVRVPIAQRQPLAYDLSVAASYRYSNYSTNITTNTYGVGGDWAPIREAKVRASYQRAVRAANIIELFTAQGYNLFGGSDPCGAPVGGTPSATLAQCLRTGLAPSQYGAAVLLSPAGQYNYLQGGNPDLQPETAKNYTVGGVFQPWPNLSATVDYWHYDVDNVIGVIPPALTLNSCITSGTLCDLIHRGPNGNLWLPNQGYVQGTNANLGKYKTDGIDFTANWLQPITSWGSVGVNFAGTWVNEFIKQPAPGFPSYDCAGLFGTTCLTPIPQWRSRLQGIWNTPWNVNAALTWRYISAVDLDLSTSDPSLAGDFGPSDQHIGSFNYFDLALQWNATKNFTIRGGINNIFDKDPPLVSSTGAQVGGGPYPSVSNPIFGNGNTFPQVYDTLGRNLFINVTAKF
jgi:iron complex outermembrane receptor protein